MRNHKSEKPKSSQPQSINDYTIIKDLGFGSFGKVQLVSRKSDQKQFAMKSISMARVNQKEKQAALNQIRLLASIDIPNVIEYVESFYHSDQQSLCIILEYADGGDLEHKLTEHFKTTQNKGFEEKFIWKVAYEILSGLKKLHQHKIVHRDIKSANIFFVKGIAKLGDLNISKITENGFCSTQTGTPYYTSPEIWKGEIYNSKCDIWALGCIIYEMATLSPPFKAKDFPTLFKTITQGKYTQLPSFYSDDLKQFIKKCLTVNTDLRPSAVQLLNTDILSGMELCLQNFDSKSQGEIKIIDPIQCPKVLKFLNSKLPQRENAKKKKTVKISQQALEEEAQSRTTKTSFKSRKIRSEKIIQPICGSVKNIASSATSKKQIKLPPLQEKEKKTDGQSQLKNIHITSKMAPSKNNFKIKKRDCSVAKSMKCIGGKQNDLPGC